MDLHNHQPLPHNNTAMDDIELLNSIQCTILATLATYTFCCISHLCAITDKSPSYLRENVGSLTRRKFLRTFKVVVTDKIRAEVFYFLSDKGLAVLQSHKNAFIDITAPSATVSVARDYFHRYWYVWLMVTLRLYAAKHSVTIEVFHSYFSKTGGKKGSLVAQTHIPLAKKGAYYVPDGVVKTSNGLYLLELYNDYGSVKRVLGSISGTASAIGIGAPGLAYNMQANPKVLAIFTHESTMKTVVKRLQQQTGLIPEMAKLFFFSTIKDFQQNISNAKNIYGTPFTFT